MRSRRARSAVVITATMLLPAFARAAPGADLLAAAGRNPYTDEREGHVVVWVPGSLHHRHGGARGVGTFLRTEAEPTSDERANLDLTGCRGDDDRTCCRRHERFCKPPACPLKPTQPFACECPPSPAASSA